MSLTQDDVKKIAHLARLSISEDDIPAYEKELSNILNLVEQMSAFDTSDVAPMAHPLDMVQRLRDDVVTETDHHERYQDIAPGVENSLYLVPQVIE